MRRISERIREKIFGQLLRGDSYDKIARDNDVSKSTVYEVKEESKKKLPDIEDFRRLSVLMRKANISFYEAARGAQLIENLNMAGVSLDQLDYYIKLMEKILSGEDAGGEKIPESVMKLVALEETTGKDYLELVNDFEKKASEVTELEAQKADLLRSVVELENQLKKDEKDLERVTAEISVAVATKMRIRNLGLPKLARLAKFVDDYEMLGFSPEMVQKLTVLRGMLLRRSIDPEELEDHLEKTGSLDTQLSELRRQVGDLNLEHVRLKSRVGALIRKNEPLAKLDKILTTRRLEMPCKICGTLLPVPLWTRERYQALLAKKEVLEVLCPRCGPQWFTPNEIVAKIGWVLLPIGIAIVPISTWGRSERYMHV